jgi:hypothetical protein
MEKYSDRYKKAEPALEGAARYVHTASREDLGSTYPKSHAREKITHSGNE